MFLTFALVMEVICSPDAGTLVLVLLAGLLTAGRVIHTHLDRRCCSREKLTSGFPTSQWQWLHETKSVHQRVEVVRAWQEAVLDVWLEKLTDVSQRAMHSQLNGNSAYSRQLCLLFSSIPCRTCTWRRFSGSKPGQGFRTRHLDRGRRSQPNH